MAIPYYTSNQGAKLAKRVKDLENGGGGSDAVPTLPVIGTSFHLFLRGFDDELTPVTAETLEEIAEEAEINDEYTFAIILSNDDHRTYQNLIDTASALTLAATAIGDDNIWGNFYFVKVTEDGNYKYFLNSGPGFICFRTSSGDVMKLDFNFSDLLDGELYSEEYHGNVFTLETQIKEITNLSSGGGSGGSLPEVDLKLTINVDPEEIRQGSSWTRTLSDDVIEEINKALSSCRVFVAVLTFAINGSSEGAAEIPVLCRSLRVAGGDLTHLATMDFSMFGIISFELIGTELEIQLLPLGV